MSSLDSIAPIISSAVFTIIFKESITDLPGACFFVQAALAFIPIFVIFWIDLFTVIPSNDTKQNDKPHADVYEGTTNL